MVKGNISCICNVYIFKQMECIPLFPIELTLIKMKRIARHSLLDQMLIFSICQ